MTAKKVDWVDEVEVKEKIAEAKKFNVNSLLGRTVLVTTGMGGVVNGHQISGQMFAGIITAISGNSETQYAYINVQLPFEPFVIGFVNVPNRRFGDETTPAPYFELLPLDS